MERPFLLLLFVLSVAAFLVNELFAIQGLIKFCAPCTEEGILNMLGGTLTAVLVAVLVSRATSGVARVCVYGFH